MNIASTQMIPQGLDLLIEMTGVVENRGEEPAYDFNLIIEMTPKDSKQKDLKATKTISMGMIEPGDQKDYVGHVQLKRGVDFKGSPKCEYVHDGKLVKGATKSF